MNQFPVIHHQSQKFENRTGPVEQRAQWSAPAWAAYSALYSIFCVPSSLSTGYMAGGDGAVGKNPKMPKCMH